ncbi:MAG: Holliday junction DNA helicase RuvA [Candidatus Vogelbacteria bacterium RIFOXYD1_FULL_46_19]|uniref:Holliday junction branch migration complex subunit RuvA n=1 Tax=Candidatus Vogelbacteria bacterium RIFOXYD1_FULL_46_19 TaxID=1802439 RepID=A0A1G2QJ58_9BACT|nr:MAG: Holliday junction DNA helicase RuvA [Candidatus Vogelbacteria bacterium RIFOXYD1_FULL_46_19]
MIGYLKGDVTHFDDKIAIISVSGVGYSVYLPVHVLVVLALGQSLSLWTHLAVREDALELFGFTDREELTYFKLLIGISGIGPKSALAILSLAPPTTLRQAILTNNTEYLTKVSGIGRKSAEKIIIELRDKLGSLADGEIGLLDADSDVAAALLSLGYQPKEIREALKNISNDITSTDKKIKEALRWLSSGRKS